MVEEHALQHCPHMIPLGLLLFPVAVVVMVTISALRRRDARKTTERWRQALAQLEVTAEGPALQRSETKLPVQRSETRLPLQPLSVHRSETKPPVRQTETKAPVQHRSEASLDAYIAAAFRDVEEDLASQQPEASEDALTNVTMTSLKKQMEVMSRSRLARGSQPPPGRETLEEEAIAPTQSLRRVARERTGQLYETGTPRID